MATRKYIAFTPAARLIPQMKTSLLLPRVSVAANEGGAKAIKREGV